MSIIGLTNAEVEEQLLSLDDLERMYILEVLEFFKFDRVKTAKALMVSHKTLQNKLGRYRVEGHAVPDRRRAKPKLPAMEQ